MKLNGGMKINAGMKMNAGHQEIFDCIIDGNEGINQNV